MSKFNLSKRLGTLCVLALLAVTIGNAQSSTQGAIAGTVFDATGAVVGKARITIHNTATNAEINLTSDDSGYFKAPLVEPGTYTVTVSSSGFSAYRATGVSVQVGQ